MDNFPALRGLGQAVTAWVNAGQSEALERWLARELDEEGGPRRLAIPDGWDCLGELIRARDERSGWPRRLDGRILGLTRFLLRLTRGDATPVRLSEGGTDPGVVRALLGRVGRLFPGSREARVIAWMLGLPEPHHNPPPLPAWSSPNLAIAVLRAEWKRKGDLLAIDQRGRSPAAGLELVGSGVPWLGSEWRLADASSLSTPGRPILWQSNSAADLFEWSYRAEGLRLTRTVLVLRGRRLALLGEQFQFGPGTRGPLEARLGLNHRVQVAPLEGARGVRLSVEGSRASAQVLPIGLPAAPYETDRGHLQASQDDGLIRLGIAPRGQRGWMPILVSWDPARHRRRLSWRQLTITQDGRVCPPETAFAVRVSWGREECLVIYRSLGPPARRAFLGYQTPARFLVGRFTTEGVVEPLVSVEE